jgi:hypothetical protein
MLAYNQQNGTSAVQSFGEANHDTGTDAKMLLGIGVPSTNTYDFDKMTSPDEIRQNYTSITLQTSPETTQQVIQMIRTNPKGDYKLYSNNCTTTCSKILRDLKLINDKPVSPKGFFIELYNEYGNGSFVLPFAKFSVEKRQSQTRLKPRAMKYRHWRRCRVRRTQTLS